MKIFKYNAGVSFHTKAFGCYCVLSVLTQQLTDFFKIFYVYFLVNLAINGNYIYYAPIKHISTLQNEVDCLLEVEKQA